MSEPKDGTYPVKGADEQTIVIGEGGWYRNTKDRARRMMLNSLSGKARRVYAALELGTMGYSQELAVTMHKGRQIHLTMAKIGEWTELRRDDVAEALDELEQQGLAERRPINPELPLQKGNIAIYSWAVPRSPKERIVHARGYKLPSWFPPSWKPIAPLVKRLKLNLRPEFVPARVYKKEVEDSAREYKKAEDSLLALLQQACAQEQSRPASLLKRTERNSPKGTPSSSVFSTGVIKAEEEEQPPTWATFKALYPPDQLEGPKAKPIFEALSLAEKRNCIKRLQVYLQCERWVDQPEYVPHAPNWLKSDYNEDPPKAFRVAAAGKQKSFEENVDEEAAKRLKKWGHL
jgi:hypothetical protein